MNEQATWMHAQGWASAHAVILSKQFWHNGERYAKTVCNRRVSVARLEPEPTGIDTINRCPSCRRYASDFGLEDSP